MPEETTKAPVDFASLATKVATTDESKQAELLKSAAETLSEPPAKKEPATEVKEKKETATKEPERESRKVPEELFGKKVEAETKREPAEEELETSKIEAPQFKDKKSQDGWNQLREKATTFEKEAKESVKRISEMEAKIKDFDAKNKDTDALQTKLAQLEKEHGEAMALVRKVNIELDPAFREQFIEGRKKLMNNARKIVEESGGDASSIETALNLNGKPRVDALKEIAEGMDSFQQGRLGRVIDELTALDETAASKRSNPDEYLTARQKEQQEAQQKERDAFTRNANMAFDKVDAKLSSELEVLRAVDGLEWWNDQAKGIRERARKNYNAPLDFEQAAPIFIKAEACDTYRDLFLSQREEHASDKKALAEAQAELKKLYGTKPTLGGKAPTTDKSGPVDFASHASNLMEGRA